MKRVKQLHHAASGIGSGRIFVFDLIASTSVEARKPCYGHGDVVVALAQTHGYGSKQRSWYSPADLNLYVSVVLDGDASVRRAAVIREETTSWVVDFLREFEIEGTVKRPNDVLVGGKKIAGLLTEVMAAPDGTGRRVVVGAGVNVFMEEDDLRKIDQPATSMVVATGKRDGLSGDVVLVKFLAAFQAGLERHDLTGGIH